MSMKKFFTSCIPLKKLSFLGCAFFSIFFVITCYGIRVFKKRQLDQKNYLLLKEASSQLFTLSKIPSLTTANMIENALKKYPNLSKEYQNFLANIYLIQGNKEKALNLLYNEPIKIMAPFEKEIMTVNNEIIRLYLEDNLKEALEKTLFLQKLLNKNKENFPMLFSLNLFRLFLITNKLNIEDIAPYIQEIQNDKTCEEIFKLFSEGEYSIKKFLNI